MPDDVRGIGDNRPPTAAALETILDYLHSDGATLDGLAKLVADALPAQLDESKADLMKAQMELHQIGKLWDEQRPDILSDDHADKAANFKEKLKAHIKAIETWHKEAKDPFLKSGRIVDNVSNAMLSDPNTILSKMLARLQRWQDKIRAEREAEAKRQRDEAQRLADSAREQQEAGNVASAQSLESRAADLQETAHALTSAPVQIRTDHGALVTERRTWDAEVLNEAKIPKKYLSYDEKKVKADIKRLKDAGGDPSTLSLPDVLRVYVKITVL